MAAVSDQAEKTRIVVVCKGNICRSPLAEILLQNLGRDLLDSRSRGVRGWHEGKSAHPDMMAVATNHGYDLSSHRGKQLEADDLAWATHVVAVDAATMDEIKSTFPNIDPTKLSLLKRDGADINDPYGGAPADFERCFAEIFEAAQRFVSGIADYTLLGKVSRWQ